MTAKLLTEGYKPLMAQDGYTPKDSNRNLASPPPPPKPPKAQSSVISGNKK